MNREEFIKRLQEQNTLSDEEMKLTKGMRSILNFFKELEKEIETPQNVKDSLQIGAQYPDYPLIIITVNKNELSFEKKSNKIKVTFVSPFNTEYSEKYERVSIDNIVLRSEEFTSEKFKMKLTDELLQKYLPYLLADHL